MLEFVTFEPPKPARAVYCRRLRQGARLAGGEDYLAELALRPHDEFGSLNFSLPIVEAVRTSIISGIVLASASARSETPYRVSALRRLPRSRQPRRQWMLLIEHSSWAPSASALRW